MRRVHVVVLTAIPQEYQAVTQVDAGAWERSPWKREPGPHGLPMAFRTFRGKGGRPLRVAVVQAGDKGSVAATNALLPLIEKYQPGCVAMCGVCAGRPGKTNLGDVIAPERLFFYDTGKRTPEGVQQDIKTYNLRSDWKVELDHFDAAARFRNEAWWNQRPIPYEWQENWVLAKLHQGVTDPASHPDRENACPQWEDVIEALWVSKHLEDGTLTLTELGRQRIGRVLIKHRNRLPDLTPSGPETALPFKVHVAPMGTGNQVVEDAQVWDFISGHMRTTLGLEMEAAALGAVVHAQRDRELQAVVMKGVMDFANPGRDDHFMPFAARASAECLLAFLREHLDVEVIPGEDDLLVAGTDEHLPEEPAPSSLLHARHEVIPFQGRESILVELDRWSDEGPPVAVRLLHAEGGVGKTRLAIEWIRRRKAQGWAAGFLAKGVLEEHKDWFERLWALGQTVLVVIDYAESRPELPAVLLRILRYAQQGGAEALRRIRVLLLARNAGDWWQALRQSDAALGQWLSVPPPHELTPLASKPSEREQVFYEAAERFAEKLKKPYQRSAAVPLMDERFNRVLYLHMAALAAVEGLQFEANTLMDVILDHEERFWVAQIQSSTVMSAYQRSMARQLVAAATLRGGFEHREEAELSTERLLRKSDGLSSEEQALLLLLHRIYQRANVDPSPLLQSTDDGPSVFLPPLEPDLLGEGMVLRVASPPLREERPPADWIARVFPQEERVEVLSRGFEVLDRAASARPDVAQPWIDQLFDGPLLVRAKAALRAAKAVGRRTALSALGDTLALRLNAQGDVRVALILEAEGIPAFTVSLRRVAEWISRTLLQGLKRVAEPPASAGPQEPDAAEPPPSRRARRKALEQVGHTIDRWLSAFRRQEEMLSEMARLQALQGERLIMLGKREEAVKAAQEAVESYRALVQRNPDAFQHLLAGGLNNLGLILSELGVLEEALKAMQEAVESYRSLAQRNPEAFQHYLAMSLTNLGAMLRMWGRNEEALEVTQEAVEGYRVLAQGPAHEFQPHLATSLNNLGAVLHDLGRSEEALKAMRESVESYRTLAHHNPDAFQPDLIKSINNLGAMLREFGKHEDALKAAQEAVRGYRALAQRNPDAFQPYLAMSISNLGAVLSELGKREEAVKVAQEAVEGYRALAQRNPDAFQANLTASLNNLGPMLREVGKHEESLEAAQEAVEGYRALAQRNPDAFQHDLAMSLGNLSTVLSELGMREEALKAAQEALENSRALAQRNPDAFQPFLAGCLNNLGALLREVGKCEESLQAAQESVEGYRTLAQRNPDAFQPDLARSLNNLGATLKALGRLEDALEAVQEAVKDYRVLAQINMDAFQPDLAESLNNLGEVLGELERRQDALEAFEEALDKLWPFVAPPPHVFIQGTMTVVGNLQRTYEALQHSLPPAFQERQRLLSDWGRAERG